jgi:hypothetical protein
MKYMSTFALSLYCSLWHQRRNIPVINGGDLTGPSTEYFIGCERGLQCKEERKIGTDIAG